MKKTILLAFSCISVFFVIAQQPFHGSVTYQFNSTEEKSMLKEELSVLFGKAGIRLKYRKNNTIDKYDNEELLIIPDSGKVYIFNMDNKTYHAKKLLAYSEQKDMPARIIAGYTTTAVDVSNAMQNGLGEIFLRGSSTTLYISDSLYYPTPANLSRNLELMFIKDNHIVLGARIIRPKDRWAEEYNENAPVLNDTVEVTASQITRVQQDPSLFSIPVDFVKFSPAAFVTDSVATMVDTAMIMPDDIIDPVKAVEEKAPVKKPVPKPRPKTKAATPVRKPKS